MRHVFLTILLVGVVLTALGCKQPSEPRPQADLALDGLMPVGDPGFDVSYVMDQKKVKTLPMREIPEGSLLEIATRPSGASEEVDLAAEMPTAAPPTRAAAPAPGGSQGGFWGKLGSKTLGSALWGNPAAGDDDDGGDEDTNYEEEDTEEEDED